jgi:hypothetical protein
MLPLTVELLTSISGASPVTVTDSVTVDGVICRLSTTVCPSNSSRLRVIVVNPWSSAVTRIVPVRTGSRNAPRPSVTATNVLPVASWRAVMLTPGSTPPVESVIVPLIVASCADSNAGSARSAVIDMRIVNNRGRDVFVIGPLL